MSRLRTPEVKVIRFNEADVIVASSTLTLGGFGDMQIGNATGTYKNVTTGNVNDLIHLIQGDYPNEDDPTIVNNNNDASTIRSVFDDELGTDSAYNGTYRWSGGRFVKTSGTNQ